MQEEPKDFETHESKTQRKKDMQALQDVGKVLVELSESELAGIPLEPILEKAIREARRLKTHEAKRRQLQYIGKLMRQVDIAPIQAALAKIQLRDQVSKAKFHQVERWRDQLIAGDDSTLENFIKQYPTADRQQMRQLIRKSQQDLKVGKDSGATKSLFRYLRDIILMA